MPTKGEGLAPAGQTIAVIVRFKDEAAYLGAVLRAVRAQQGHDASIRVIGIDNGSSDGSGALAAHWCDRVLETARYRPGGAINLALLLEPCDYAIVLSAHTIPANRSWAANLLAAAVKPDTLGCYGAQLYPCNSRFLDKRDLDVFSSPRPRIETKDSDFWNANSIFPRRNWEVRPFDERPFELEDHYWTKCCLNGTNCVRFVPDALVYHYGHVARNDRVFQEPSALADDTRIGQAIKTLEAGDADWPDTMMAALTIKSLHLCPTAATAEPALIRHLHEHPDFDVRWRVAGALGKFPTPGSIEALITALCDSSFYVRDEAAWALAALGTAAAPRLLFRLDTLPRREWPLAAMALGLSGDPLAQERAAELLEFGISTRSGELRRNYIYAAGELSGVRTLRRVAAGLNAALRDDDPDIRAVAAWGIGSLADTLTNDAEWGLLCDAAVNDSNPLVRGEAAVALGKQLCRQWDAAALDALCRTAGDAVGLVRYMAVQAARLLAEHGRAIEAFPIVHDDDDFGVQFEAELLGMGAKRRARCLESGQ